MVEIFKLEGGLTKVVAGIAWAGLNAQGGDISIYANQAIVAGGTLTSTAIATASYHSGYVTITNSGASTNLEVKIESSTTSGGSVKTSLISCVLNATTKPSVGYPVAVLPNYIFITAINLDTGDAATLSVTISL
jgi:hypothetical protein